jgi:Phage protein (N4 Gp49/phage Sf6 gene 66) family
MISSSEAAIEAEIKTKGLTGRRITPAGIDKQIVWDDYHVFPRTTMTVCALHLANGYIVIGQSACADGVNFDEAIGRRLAYADARNKIWALEDYLLRDEIHHMEAVAEIVREAGMARACGCNCSAQMPTPK